VKNKKGVGLEFIIDKLTNSIENVITKDSFATEVSVLLKTDLKFLNKANGWQFNWKEEYKIPSRDIYKLTIVNNSRINQFGGKRRPCLYASGRKRSF
jgi:hypothetical protein